MHNYIYNYIFIFHTSWMLCLFDINFEIMRVIFCVYKIVYLIQFIYIYIYNIFIHLRGSSSSHWPQMSLTTTIYKLSTAQRFSYFLMAGPYKWNKLQNIRIWDGFQCQIHKFHDFNGVFFIYENHHSPI